MDMHTSKLVELFSFYQYAEAEYPVNQWMINGIHIWPYVRLQMFQGANIFGNLQRRHGETKKKRTWINYGELIWHTVKNSGIQIIIDNAHRERVRNADVVLGGDGIGRCLEIPNEGVFDIYLGAIQFALQREGIETFKFEYLGLYDYKAPYFGNSFLIDPLILKYLIKRKLFDEKMDVSLVGYEKLLNDFEGFGFDSSAIAVGKVIKDILWIHNLSNEFIEKFKRINPHIVLVENWRSSQSMALLHAAKVLHIPSVDIQYATGAADEMHEGYYPWTNIPTEGYELMPDYMWVWNQEDYDKIVLWGKEWVVPFIGGPPMNLFWFNSENSWSKELQKKFEEIFASKKPAILFSLQWATDYPQWLIDFINESDQYNWLLRLHPVVDDTQKCFLKKIKIGNEKRWECVASFPLAILLKNVSLHITPRSSTVLEAEAVHCPSIVIEYVATKMFNRQIQKGTVRYAKNREELSAVICDVLSKRKVNSVNKDCAKELYERGYAGIRRLIEIMEKHKSCPHGLGENG